jgi:adsorption protein B
VANGGFLPSCGVGTALSRAAIRILAHRYANRVFEPECLTEDYELGLRVHREGLHQAFVPLGPASAIATREFFPHSFAAAVRQRTRWITGIALQSWDRNGWGRNWKERYWFWRDRKGLVGHPLSLLGNAVFAWGLATALWSWWAAVPWGMGRAGVEVVWAGVAVQVWRIGCRSVCCARLYGFSVASLGPARLFWANLINFAATLSAVKRFAISKLRRTPLPWLKTAHALPSASALRAGTAARAAHSGGPDRPAPIYSRR